MEVMISLIPPWVDILYGYEGEVDEHGVTTLNILDDGAG